jgi:hypothetical protein
MYRDADEVKSFRVEAPVPTGRLQALLVHLGITTIPKYRIKEVPHPGQVEFKAITEIGSSAGTRGQLSKRLVGMLLLTPPSRPSLHGSVATRIGCKALSTTSYLAGRRTSSRSLGVKKDVLRMDMVHH